MDRDTKLCYEILKYSMYLIIVGRYTGWTLENLTQILQEFHYLKWNFYLKWHNKVIGATGYASTRLNQSL